MTDSAFPSLETAINDEHFPEVDILLRRGRHIGRDDVGLYEFLIDAQVHLEVFYRRFDCELVQQSDGYFYLLPDNERLGRRHLSSSEMLVGQTLALLYLDPASIQQRGVVKREAVLERLAGLLGNEFLVRTLNLKKRRFNERLEGEGVRSQVGEAIRRLGELGFVDAIDEVHIRLRPALMRFAEPVRAQTDLQGAMERLVARGEVMVVEPSTELIDESSQGIDPAQADEDVSP